MAEQRLIDANALREDWLENGENEYVYDTNSFLSSLDNAPTIDPENITVVRQLREELARVTVERDAAVKDLETVMRIYSEDDYIGLSCFLCCVCSKNEACDGSCEPKWRGPQKKG